MSLQEQLEALFFSSAQFKITMENQQAEALRDQAVSLKTSAEIMEAVQAENLEKAKVDTKAARLLCQQYRNLMRPSITLRAEVTLEHGPDGEFWRAKFGDCVGEGVTPETACQDFDRVWTGKDCDDWQTDDS